MPSTQSETTVDITQPPRLRLLDGLEEVLAQRSYAELTIADIVAAARVSRRTFYEHFADKDACLLALCERLSEEVLALVIQEYDPNGDWAQELRKVTWSYLHSLQQRPALVRSLYLEVLTLGSKGLAIRRRISDRFSEFLILQVDIELSRRSPTCKRALSPALAAAIVGGIHELILHAIEEGRADRLVELQQTISTFTRAVLSSLMADPAQEGPARKEQ